MARFVTLGNGQMQVGIDHYGLVSDLFYPYIGLENHVTARRLHHRIGVWVDGDFSWIDDEKWHVKTYYQAEDATGGLLASCDDLKVSLETHDFIDVERNVFARNLHVVNHADREREIRVFWHQVFEIANSQAGDTAQYRPLDQVVTHYKGRRAFAIYAEDHDSGKPFDSYSVGLYGSEGREGTYKDAEDGELSCNAVEHGSVDSVIRVVSHIKPMSSARQYYWLAASDRPHSAVELHKWFKKEGLHKRQQLAITKRRELIAPSLRLADQLPDRYRLATVQSLGVILANIDKRGAVLASGDSDMLNYGRDYYHYCWPRDAVNVLYSLMAAGHRQPVFNFLDFCTRTMNQKGYMMHKYMADGSLGSSWHPYIHRGQPELPIQEDETAGVVWLIGKCWKQTSDKQVLDEYYEALVRPMSEFMCEYMDEQTGLPHASYDLWEEKFLTTTYTTSLVAQALEFAGEMAASMDDQPSADKWSETSRKIKSKIAKVFWDDDTQCFIKGYYLNDKGERELDKTIDSSSFYGLWRFRALALNDEKMLKAYQTIKDKIYNKEGAGGFLRYNNDNYLRANSDSLGNPWIITTLWIAQYAWRADDQLYAKELLDWALDKALHTGVLSEQINPRTSQQIGVAPLNWSHAELIYSIMTFHALGL